MEQQTWWGHQTAWFPTWRGWSFENTGLITASSSQCGVSHTDWTWLFKAFSTCLLSNQFSGFVIGSRQKGKPFVIRNGWKKDIQMINWERFLHHLRHDGHFTKMFLKFCYHKLVKLMNFSAQTKILSSSKQRFGRLRHKFQAHLFPSFRTTLCSPISVSLILFSRELTWQTPNCKSDILCSLTLG